jgi:sugar phosphate isomerase/epimerase
MMKNLCVSMVSFKNENPVDVLEVFERLGFNNIELHQHYFIEKNIDPLHVCKYLEERNLNIKAMSGGWCDFFSSSPYIEETFESVSRQVKITNYFSCNKLRLFFGRLDVKYRSAQVLEKIVSNLKRLSDRFQDTLFVFENHNGLSLIPEFNAEVFDKVNRPNIRMTFDPVNFQKHGINPEAALKMLYPNIAHVHLKGLKNNNICGYGEGDFTPDFVVNFLRGLKYTGLFSLEYEGTRNAIIGLLRSYTIFKEMHS